MSSVSADDPEHPILADAHTWEIVGFNLQKDPVDQGEPYLDLTVRRDRELRVLRFWSPRDVEIQKGGPAMTHGLSIVDVSSRGLEGIGVRVCDFEASPGSVSFWARTVEDRT
jgi:hypothetical protein